MRAKSIVIPQGLTGELAARGEAEVAIQQVSELMAVPGVDIVGPLPEALNTRAIFSGGLFTVEAGRLLDAIARAMTPERLRAKGLLSA